MREVNEPTRLSVSAHLVDARGKACPAPIIELAKALKGHVHVELWADDPAARGDLDAFAAATGHRVLELQADNVLRALVQRRG
ncbi:MAG: sulfurtransferase TusA family protein [Myxococcota bacterium]